jgi:E3 ubiquitin-protein ligase mind-bomb
LQKPLFIDLSSAYYFSDVIQQIVISAGHEIEISRQLGSAERLKVLEHKIAEIEEANCCSICMERPRNVVFLCGHTACDICSQPLKVCHMCRKPITNKINMF